MAACGGSKGKEVERAAVPHKRPKDHRCAGTDQLAVSNTGQNLGQNLRQRARNGSFGSEVVAHSLNAADLNGCRGTVVGIRDNGRIEVEFGDGPHKQFMSDRLHDW